MGKRVVREHRQRTCRELPEEVDPYVCAECLSTGETCPFHNGYAEGWDAAVAVMASGLDR
jgi:hypothetical protein